MLKRRRHQREADRTSRSAEQQRKASELAERIAARREAVSPQIASVGQKALEVFADRISADESYRAEQALEQQRETERWEKVHEKQKKFAQPIRILVDKLDEHSKIIRTGLRTEGLRELFPGSVEVAPSLYFQIRNNRKSRHYYSHYVLSLSTWTLGDSKASVGIGIDDNTNNSNREAYIDVGENRISGRNIDENTSEENGSESAFEMRDKVIDAFESLLVFGEAKHGLTDEALDPDRVINALQFLAGLESNIPTDS